MSRRGLLIALMAVGAVLLATVGVLIGVLLRSSATNSSAGPRHVMSGVDHSSGEPADGVTRESGNAEHGLSARVPPTQSERGTAAANIACAWIDSLDTYDYWTEVVAVHGADVGKIKNNSTDAKLADAERSVVREVHSDLGAATTYDSRWIPLQQLVTGDEQAAIKLWDGGGLTVVQAAMRAVGSDVGTIHGICESARNQLNSRATARGETPEQLLIDTGATANQIKVWQLWNS